MNDEEYIEGLEETDCLECGNSFVIGEDGNELGLCEYCAKNIYDCDKYYKDYENNLVAFKGLDTISRGILKPYRIKKEGETDE